MAFKMIKNDMWRIDFTQSNAYAEKMIKTKEEYEFGVENPNVKSNMKKITIRKTDIDSLFNFYGWEKNVYPQYIKEVKIYKNDLKNFFSEIKKELVNQHDWFRGGVEIFDIDEDLLNANDIIRGIIKVDLRDKNRKEVVIEFGNYNNMGEFISYKVKDNRQLVFNHSVFSCSYDKLTYLEFDLSKNRIWPKINFDDLNKWTITKPISKKYTRRGKK